jgi:Protein of unknown function (DUF1071)
MSPLDLLKINVNEHTEKKNGMTYLSWAWAWTEVLKADPSANFEVKMFPDGTGIGMTPVMPIGDTAMVWVSSTVFGKSIICQLPVLDYRNKPIAHPNSMDVNTAIMRCLVKSIALHGLGLYIYSGEDMPLEDTKVVTVTTPAATMQMTVPADAPLPETINTTDSPPITAPEGEWTDEDAIAIGDALLHFLDLHRSIPDLNSYWKRNEVLLNKLKVRRLETYTNVRNGFAEYKKTLQGESK